MKHNKIKLDGNVQTLKLIRTLKLPSIKSSREEWEEKIWNELLKLPINAQSSKEASSVFNLITTKTERKRISLRLTALVLLIDGLSYRAIGRKLWLSRQTVSSLIKGLKNLNFSSYRNQSGNKTMSQLKSSKRPPRKTQRIGHPHKTKYGTIWI